MTYQLQTDPRGGFCLASDTDPDEKIYGPFGRPLDLAEAEEALDAIEILLAIKRTKPTGTGRPRRSAPIGRCTVSHARE